MPVWLPGVTWDDYVFPAATSTDEVSELPLKISPNPASDYLLLELENLSPVTLQIVDYQGKLVLNKTQMNPQKSIDLKQLQAGIYFIYVKQGDTVSIGKFMKL